MKRIGLVIAVLLLTLQTATGQTAKAVLDKVWHVVCPRPFLPIRKWRIRISTSET